MKNSTASTTLVSTGLKKTDHLDILTMVPEGRLNSRQPLDSFFNVVLKRSFDILFSSFLIIFVLSWLFPLIALWIKLDGNGPVFFLQKRRKKSFGFFTCIKFRTMVVNEEANFLSASENDLRITRPGRFLRKHHLDELPQLLNVWWGDMSMIGPRPHMPSEDLKYGGLLTNYNYRYSVKPGLTGLAQVRGYVGVIGSVDSLKERIQQDIFYIHNWSLALDIRIAYRTFFKMIGR